MTAQVRRRCRDGHAGLCNEVAGDFSRGHPDSNCVEPSRGHSGDKILCGNYHGEGPRPAFIHQFLHVGRHEIRKFLHIVFLRYVDDHRIIRGSSLGLVYFAHRFRIQCIGSESVDSLRGESHQAAGSYDLRRGPYIFFTCRKYLCIQKFPSSDQKFFIFSAWSEVMSASTMSSISPSRKLSSL